MDLDTRLLAKLTILAFRDQSFDKPVPDASWTALFNPTELSYVRKNSYNDQASAGASKGQKSFRRGGPDSVSLELFFDGTGVVDDEIPVRARIESLLRMIDYQSDVHQPYYLRAFWGSWQFQGVMTEAKVTYKLFDRAGLPIRATVQVTLQEVMSPEEIALTQRDTSPDLHQTWVVREGDTIDRIAATVYDDPAFWHPLAVTNGLRNPRQLRTGMILSLPPKA